MPGLFMLSLGCAKNLVDAETILGETLGEEFSLALEPEDADIILVNTCGFIEDARNEGRNAFTSLREVKRDNPSLRLIALGCWAERNPEELRREFPFLDAVWGLAAPSDLSRLLRELLAGKTPALPPASPLPREGARLLSTPPSFSYLRLSDGCDNRCRYCAIPLIRGGLRSRRPEAIVEEAKQLAGGGVPELVLISQDTTAYGMDLGKPGSNLASLLEQLLTAVDVPRLRLLYAHPGHITDEVIRLVREEPRLCGYLDLPIQHASNSVLARMGRGYDKERILRILEGLGPDVTVRTTILAGFPGETDDDVREVVELIERGGFRHLGAFSYSPEPGTPACSFPEQTPAEEAERRKRAVLVAQEPVSFAWLDSRLGGVEELLVDSYADDNDDWLLARSRHEAPDADGVIRLRSRHHHPGDAVMACITGRDGYDLEAKAVKTKPAGKARRPKKAQR